jgi:hypothetical protein
MSSISELIAKTEAELEKPSRERNQDKLDYWERQINNIRALSSATTTFSEIPTISRGAGAGESVHASYSYS